MKNEKQVAEKSSKCSMRFQKFKEPQKITHLYLHDQYLKKIPPLHVFSNLTVLYLHNNEINQIERLENAEKLESLYLQKNRILRINNLQRCLQLRKLYLGHNSISVMEGLESLKNLEELHLEKQSLVPGNCLCFDPRTVLKISGSLRILNITGNKIGSILNLAALHLLVTINASDNELEDLEELCQVLRGWNYLKEACFSGNPLTKQRSYQENIIASTYCLKVLDKKDISEATRFFLKKLHESKATQKLRKRSNLAQQIKDLPHNYPVALEKTISASVLKENKDLLEPDQEIFNEENAVYIPWNSLPKPRTIPRIPIEFKKQSKEKLKRSSHNVNNRLSNLQI